MTIARALPRLVGPASLALAVLLAGGACVYYPNVADIGGTRIVPHNGRAVRELETARFYVDLDSTGKFGDAIIGVVTPAARDARLVSGSGVPIARLDVPGGSKLSLRPGNQHVVLSNLTRALNAGEVIVVTLVFEKTGRLGVVAVVE